MGPGGRENDQRGRWKAVVGADNCGAGRAWHGTEGQILWGLFVFNADCHQPQMRSHLTLRRECVKLTNLIIVGKYKEFSTWKIKHENIQFCPFKSEVVEMEVDINIAAEKHLPFPETNH